MKQQPYTSVFLCAILLAACTTHHTTFDASGSFEAQETIISSEVTGTILSFPVQEGQRLRRQETVGYIDSTQLHLRRQQLHAQIQAVLSQRPDINAQLAGLQVQLAAASREQQRMQKLVSGGAATQRQLDDATSQVETLERQIHAQQSTLSITTKNIEDQVAPLRIQVAQLDDQIARCRLVSPLEGTVLTKYAEAYEMATPGKPLFKMADLASLTLRAYITGSQLPHVKLNQQVTVRTDDGQGGYAVHEGTVIWISDKAEFTPKTIQTKDERANLVYAMKVSVPNDGSIKIGMYGEVEF